MFLSPLLSHLLVNVVSVVPRSLAIETAYSVVRLVLELLLGTFVTLAWAPFPRQLY